MPRHQQATLEIVRELLHTPLGFGELAFLFDVRRRHLAPGDEVEKLVAPSNAVSGRFTTIDEDGVERPRLACRAGHANHGIDMQDHVSSFCWSTDARFAGAT